jgi:UPF0042 nucleotide-binding protein
MQTRSAYTKMSKRHVALPRGCQVQLIAYGIKNGPQNGCDLSFDVRGITNPHHDPKLRVLTGLDQAVIDDVMGHSVAKHKLEEIVNAIGVALTKNPRITVGIYCLGGRHRSVAITMAVGHTLIEKGVSVETILRDRERWKE